MLPIKKITSDFFKTAYRFPLPLIAGTVAFVLFFIQNHFLDASNFAFKNFVLIKIILSCINAISLFFAFDIYSEQFGIKLSQRIGFFLLTFCVLGLHFFNITPQMFDHEAIFLSRYILFFVVFHLFVAIAAYAKSRFLKEFWQYNLFLFIRFFTSFVFSLALYIGLASALWAVCNLFGFQVSGRFYSDIALFILFVFNTGFFLMGIPKKFSDFAQPIEYKKALRIFVQYILLPIIGIYFTILYVYLFKIVFMQSIPKGMVCMPILILSALGILAYLLIYPIRNNKEHKIIYVYAKYFFFLLLPLLSLYFIAIFLRIKPYGITEDRYLVAVLGVWLLLVSIYIITSKRDNIIFLPISLLTTLFISAVGPWGMFQLSVQNQVLRLEKNLKRNHILIHHQIVHPKNEINENDSKSIQSIISFLHKRDELDKIKKWFTEDDRKKIETAQSKDNIEGITALFGIKQQYLEDENAIYYITAKAKTPNNKTIEVKGFNYMQSFYASNEKQSSDSNYNFQIVENKLVYNIGNKNYQRYTLDTLLTIFKNKKILLDSISNENLIPNENKNFTIEQDSLIIVNNFNKLIFSTIEIQKIGNEYKIIHVEGTRLY